MVSSPAPTSTLEPSSSLGPCSPTPPLRPISSSLNGSSASSARASSSVTTRRRNRCRSLTIRPIDFSIAFRSPGVNGSVDVEVVVEAVDDRRPDPQFGIGPQALHGLGGDVGGRMPQDRQPLRSCRSGPARPARRRPAAVARSRNSPSILTATTDLSSPNRSSAVWVLSITCGVVSGSPEPRARTTVIDMADTTRTFLGRHPDQSILGGRRGAGNTLIDTADGSHIVNGVAPRPDSFCTVWSPPEAASPGSASAPVVFPPIDFPWIVVARTGYPALSRSASP